MDNSELIERLDCDCDSDDCTFKLAKAALVAADAHVKALEKEVERLRGDAMRYCWLRDYSCPPHNFYISVPDEFAGVKYSASEVDNYIDSALAALEARDA